MTDLARQKVLVIGGTSGIGHGVARAARSQPATPCVPRRTSRVPASAGSGTGWMPTAIGSNSTASRACRPRSQIRASAAAVATGATTPLTEPRISIIASARSVTASGVKGDALLMGTTMPDATKR